MLKRLSRLAAVFLLTGLVVSCARFDEVAPPIIPPKPFVYQNVPYEHPAFALMTHDGVIPVGANNSPAFRAMSKRHQSAATDFFEAYSTCYYIKGNLRWTLNINNETYRTCGIMLEVMVKLYKEGYNWGQFIRAWGNKPFNELLAHHQKCLEQDLNGNAVINDAGKLAFFCGSGYG